MIVAIVKCVLTRELFTKTVQSSNTVNEVTSVYKTNDFEFPFSAKTPTVIPNIGQPVTSLVDVCPTKVRALDKRIRPEIFLRTLTK